MAAVEANFRKTIMAILCSITIASTFYYFYHNSRKPTSFQKDTWDYLREQESKQKIGKKDEIKVVEVPTLNPPPARQLIEAKVLQLVAEPEVGPLTLSLSTVPTAFGAPPSLLQIRLENLSDTNFSFPWQKLQMHKHLYFLLRDKKGGIIASCQLQKVELLAPSTPARTPDPEAGDAFQPKKPVLWVTTLDHFTKSMVDQTPNGDYYLQAIFDSRADQDLSQSPRVLCKSSLKKAYFDGHDFELKP